MSERRSTGLTGLDAQLGGGMLPGTVQLLVGQPMNAFELFGYHFAAGGTKTGGVRFLSTDRTPEDVLDGIQRVGGDPRKTEVVSLPHKGKWAIPALKAGFRYIIDDLGTMVLAIGFEETMAHLVKMRDEARAEGLDVLVTLTDGLLPAQEQMRFKQWADGVLELGFDRQGFGLYPYLKVTKMRGVPESSRFILFKETEAGLFMESTRRVF